MEVLSGPVTVALKERATDSSAALLDASVFRVSLRA
jgi:hypothetical protein